MKKYILSKKRNKIIFDKNMKSNKEIPIFT